MLSWRVCGAFVNVNGRLQASRLRSGSTSGKEDGRTSGEADEALRRSTGGRLPKLRAAAGAHACLVAIAADAGQPRRRNRWGGVGVPEEAGGEAHVPAYDLRSALDGTYPPNASTPSNVCYCAGITDVSNELETMKTNVCGSTASSTAPMRLLQDAPGTCHA